METSARQFESSQKPACPVCGLGSGLGTQIDMDTDEALNKERLFYAAWPNHMVGFYSVQPSALDHSVECLHVQQSQITNITRPAINAGRFGVLPRQNHNTPAHAGFFNVQEKTMLKKAEPIAKYSEQPNPELQARADEIMRKMKQERQQQREAMAHLFLAGPEAWPESTYDENIEDDRDFEEWVPLDTA